MSLIKWEGLGYQATHPAGPLHFPISTLTQMTHRILMGGEKRLVPDLMEYTCYEDVKYYLLQSIQYVLKPVQIHAFIIWLNIRANIIIFLQCSVVFTAKERGSYSYICCVYKLSVNAHLEWNWK